MAKTLKDLLLALINATLILLAVCLFFAWNLARSVENIQDKFAHGIQAIQPLRNQAQSLQTELVELQDDLSNIQGIRTEDPEAQRELLAALTRLKQIETKLEETQSRLNDLAENPYQLIDYAITTSLDAVSLRIRSARGSGEAS